ncbi:hypothetical protein A4A49_29136 [Nicotiana attenuata]|uniref:Uncharacterized protein n=1 Tax=Nicotiana attenuata TaxID=49451 RepID=A0A1J6KXR5_NICAT|nr:hypothetical protein A4A49_29136 [Nicotiana attenuata]
MLLMMMEGAMVLCGQRVLLRNPKIILLIESTIVLATGLHRIVEETQVKCDPPHGKMLACCRMVSADIFPKVVNVVLANISCHLDTVIDHIFSYHRDYLRIVTIGGTSVTNIVLNPNLKDKVLIEERSIVMNEIGQKTKVKDLFEILENFVWDPGKREQSSY